MAGGLASGGSLLDASGYVVARRKATVAAKVLGKVSEVLIEEGQRVEKDQVIARLDDSNARAAFEQARAQVVQAEANVKAAEAAYDNARPLYERNKKLVGNGTISATIYENSKTAADAARTGLDVAQSSVGVARSALTYAQRTLEDMTVRAPFTGVVTVKAAQPGEIVSPNSAGGGFTRTGICTIVDMDSLEVEVDVSENFISRVHANQPATIKLNAYPDWQIPGEIIAVIPTADRAKATVQVRVGFKEKDDRVVPEMGARVSFLSDTPVAAGAPAPSPGVVVPLEAVQANGDSGTVFVIRDNKVERRTVRLGARNTDGQTILSGVTAADRLAVGDFTQLSDGARIRVE
jgi:RND family efflux transporter MFP subunit